MLLLKGRAAEDPDPCHSSTGPACDDPSKKHATEVAYQLVHLCIDDVSPVLVGSNLIPKLSQANADPNVPWGPSQRSRLKPLMLHPVRLRATALQSLVTSAPVGDAEPQTGWPWPRCRMFALEVVRRWCSRGVFVRTEIEELFALHARFVNVSSERLTMRAIETADAALILACLRADDCGSPRADHENYDDSAAELQCGHGCTAGGPVRLRKKPRCDLTRSANFNEIMRENPKP